MAEFPRRLFLGGAAGTIGMPLVARYAHAAEFTLKVSTDVPPQWPLNVRVAEALERIKNRTGGQVEMTLYPNSQLGGDMLQQTRTGSIEFCVYSCMLIAPLVPVSGLTAVGFAFKDVDTAYSAMDGDLGAFILPQLERAGFHAMRHVMGVGFRDIISGSKVIKTPDDLQGFLIRVPVTPMLVSLFNKLGARPTPINIADLYTALQTKVVDGAENTLSLLYAFKYYEVQKYVSMTNHSWDGYWILANGRVWRGIPQNLQQIIEEEIQKSTIDQRKDLVKVDAGAADDLTGKGISITYPDVMAFRNKLKASGYYSEWRTKFGPDAWNALEKYTGQLA